MTRGNRSIGTSWSSAIFPIREIRETTSSAHLIFPMWRACYTVSTDGEASLAFSQEENSPKEAGRFTAGRA